MTSREKVLNALNLQPGPVPVDFGSTAIVFDAIHNVQANTPVENIVAMLDAVREFNG